MNILFSEGSSTSARQSLYALGRLDYTIDLLDSQRLCLGRFSRYVRAWHRCPAFARDPAEYFAFLRDRLKSERYDVLLPTHDQVFLFSRFREELSCLTHLAVSDFESVRTLQSKIRFAELIKQLGLPQPECWILDSPEDLQDHHDYPCFVKLEFSTAGRGVWHVKDARQMQEAAQEITRLGSDPASRRVLVQKPAAGQYGVVQAVFQHGGLVAAHCYMLRAKGVGGSAHARQGIINPRAIQDVSLLGKALSWHGALHMEFFFDPATGEPLYIEANPRIGETMNATLSGVNLCEALVQVSLGTGVVPSPPPREGVRTHSLMSSLLAVAVQGKGRQALLSEIAHAWAGDGIYSNSSDELCRIDEDPPSVIPLTAVASRLLFSPSQAKSIINTAVDNYSLNEQTIRSVLELHEGRCESSGGIAHGSSMRS